jgi:hypothetical protein
MVVYRDRGVMWLRQVAAVAGAGGVLGAALGGGGPWLGAVSALVGVVAAVMWRLDRPRVELHADHLDVLSVFSTAVAYHEIRGFSTAARTWYGRSGLVIERLHRQRAYVPPGLGLDPPRWHLELRDELLERVGDDVL